MADKGLRWSAKQLHSWREVKPFLGLSYPHNSLALLYRSLKLTVGNLYIDLFVTPNIRKARDILNNKLYNKARLIQDCDQILKSIAGLNHTVQSEAQIGELAAYRKSLLPQKPTSVN